MAPGSKENVPPAGSEDSGAVQDIEDGVGRVPLAPKNIPIRWEIQLWFHYLKIQILIL